MSILEFCGLILVLSLFTYGVLLVANVIDKKTEESEEENPVVFGEPEPKEEPESKQITREEKRLRNLKRRK